MIDSNSRTSLPVPEDFQDDATRAIFPRQLIIYDEKINHWLPCTDEAILAITEYMAVSYRQSDFPDKVAFEEVVRITCQILQLGAYWLDFSCTGETSEEKNRDLYRIADVFRGAKKTVIMVSGDDDSPLSDGWLSWGDRIWTLPEALLSQELLFKVGTRFIKSTNLRRVANMAYKDRHEEMMLIDGYSGKDPLPVPEKVELLRRAIWKRSSGPSQVGTSKTSGEKTSMFTAYAAERVYALMGFMQYRIIPDIKESEDEAFIRLMQVNKLDGHTFSWGAAIPSLRDTSESRSDSISIEYLAALIRSHSSLESNLPRQQSLSQSSLQAESNLPLTPLIADTLHEEIIYPICYDSHYYPSGSGSPPLMFKSDFDWVTVPQKPTTTAATTSSLNKTSYVDDAKSAAKRFLTWSGDMEEVDKAVSFVKKNLDRPRHIYKKGVDMKTRYTQSSEIADLNKAISLFQEAIQRADSDDASKPWYHNELGITLLQRYWKLNNVDDLTQAMATAKEAVRLAGDKCLPVYEHNLLIFYRLRYDRLNNVSDLNQAISSGERSLRLLSTDHHERMRYNINLASTLRRRFLRTSDIKDLDRAMSLATEALRLVPSWCDSRPFHTALTASLLKMCFDQSGNIDDLNQAIDYGQDVILKVSSNDQNKESYLRNLACMLRQRYSKTSNIEDMNGAIEHSVKALQTLKEDQDTTARYHTFLATSLKARFEVLEDIADLDQSIANHDKAARSASDNNVYKALYYHTLALTLSMRFRKTGNVIDIDQAVHSEKEALRIVSDDKEKVCFNNNLGFVMRARFDRLHDLADLDQAILCKQELINLIDDGHLDKPSHLDSLGATLRRRFLYTGKSLDIDRAIASQQEAVRRTADHDGAKQRFLSNLANSLENRYDMFSDKNDLKEAIARRQEVVNLTEEGNENELLYINELIRSSDKLL